MKNIAWFLIPKLVLSFHSCSWTAPATKPQLGYWWLENLNIKKSWSFFIIIANITLFVTAKFSRVQIHYLLLYFNPFYFEQFVRLGVSFCHFLSCLNKSGRLNFCEDVLEFFSHNIHLKLVFMRFISSQCFLNCMDNASILFQIIYGLMLLVNTVARNLCVVDDF